MFYQLNDLFLSVIAHRYSYVAKYKYHHHHLCHTYLFLKHNLDIVNENIKKYILKTKSIP